MRYLFLKRLAVLLSWSVIASITTHAAIDFSDEWFTRAPTSERLVEVQNTATLEGWMPVALRVYEGSARAYELRQDDAAVAWYHVARWCDLLGRSQRDLGQAWLASQREARTLNPNVNIGSIEQLPDAPLSRLLGKDTVTWLLGDREFSETFFDQLSPYDFYPRVLEILQSLREADVRRFSNYEQLALAIALVYDAPPPPHWPHAQVSAEILPRKLPRPIDAFVFLITAEQKGKTEQKLSLLTAGELKFAVDFSASFAELTWARDAVKIPLPSFAKCYEAVPYRKERIEQDKYMWPGKDYLLPTLLKEGGICVDQAYFASQVSKAKGLPSLLFAGAGQDGRHAWFGYLGTGQGWMLDAGRTPEQRYVVGVAYNPQTWALLSDHELLFLSEGFRKLQPYRQSRQQQMFAELYLRAGQKKPAADAARKAVNFERRNFEAWRILIAASDELDPKAREGILREAAQAMQRYPDLAAVFIRDLAGSLRARNQVSAAEFEERSLVKRGAVKGRSDLAVTQAATVMSTAMADPDFVTQIKTYRQVLLQYGRDGGMDFYDRVAAPFIKNLLKLGRKTEAMQMLAITRNTLKPEFESQLAREMDELAKGLK